MSLDTVYIILYYVYMVQTLSISKARANLPTLVKNAKNKFSEYFITLNGDRAAVLISADQYDSMKETDEILADKELMRDIKAGEKDIKAGRVYDWDKVKKELGFNVQD